MAGIGLNAAALCEFMAILAAPPVSPGQALPVMVDRALLATLGELVSADVVVFNDLAPRRRSAWAFSYVMPDGDLPVSDGPPELNFYDHFWAAHSSYHDRSGDRETVTALSDFCSVRQWRRSMMCAVLGGPSFDRELTLPLPAPPGHSRKIRFLRTNGRDFDDTDRALAALVRPHLIAYLHALDLTSRGIVPLTARQHQLMSLVAGGYSNAEAARTLGISAQTVRTHLQQIYTRLGVNSRGETAALVSPPGTLGAIPRDDAGVSGR